MRNFALSRRVVLQSGLSLGGSLVLGCSSRPLDVAGATDTGMSLEGGELVSVVPFVGESDVPLEQVFNDGLDGRLYTDLTQVDEQHLTTTSEHFYIRTRYPDLLTAPERWAIRVSGGSAADSDIYLDQLMGQVTPQGVHLMECSGNARGASFGLLSTAAWNGIPLADVLAGFDAGSDAVAVLVSGFDEHSMLSAKSTAGASWVFPLGALERIAPFLATEMNDAPLLPDHGAPVRLVVPGWYGCTCIKWVNELRFVGADEPATSQMLEFASRTQQLGTPALARDYLPAEIDVAAMPTRVEKWRVGGRIRYRILGIEWGGVEPAPALEIRIGNADWRPVVKRSAATDSASWRLWEYVGEPGVGGVSAITLRVPDASVRTRRLDLDYYLREVSFDV